MIWKFRSIKKFLKMTLFSNLNLSRFSCFNCWTIISNFYLVHMLSYYKTYRKYLGEIWSWFEGEGVWLGLIVW